MIKGAFTFPFFLPRKKNKIKKRENHFKIYRKIMYSMLYFLVTCYYLPTSNIWIGFKLNFSFKGYNVVHFWNLNLLNNLKGIKYT